jgi:hypothetical protein
MDNVQNCDSYINIPSSHTCKSYSFADCYIDYRQPEAFMSTHMEKSNKETKVSGGYN